MPKITDVTNHRFGRLIAVEKSRKDSIGRWFWICRCDCGMVLEVKSNNLRTGNTKSCGCLNKEWKENFHARSERAYGCNHYRWKSDRSDIAGRPSSARRWARRVIQNNPGGCLKCRSNDNLHAHHADAWSLRPDRRNDPTNGAPLCATHHREFHRLFGREHNTQEQLHQYLEFPDIEREVIDNPIVRPSDPLLGNIFDLVVTGQLEEARQQIENRISQLKATS